MAGGAGGGGAREGRDLVASASSRPGCLHQGPCAPGGGEGGRQQVCGLPRHGDLVGHADPAQGRCTRQLRELRSHPDPGVKKVLRVFTDGASRGNPGHSGAGVVIEDEKGIRLQGCFRYLGRMTNNQAEYLALIDGLKTVAAWKPDSLQIRLDSNLLVQQIKGKYKVKNVDLKPHYERVMAMLSAQPYDVEYVPREKNRGADALANRAID